MKGFRVIPFCILQLPYLPVYNVHFFFPKFEVQNLHCALYTEPFVYCYTNLHTRECT